MGWLAKVVEASGQCNYNVSQRDDQNQPLKLKLN